MPAPAATPGDMPGLGLIPTEMPAPGQAFVFGTGRSTGRRRSPLQELARTENPHNGSSGPVSMLPSLKECQS
jgi:hypothetical protein